MKVVDIERVVILMRFIQYGWNDERKKSFDENLRMMLETQCEDLEELKQETRAEVIDECKEILLSAMARDGKTKCHEYMVAVNEMEQLKDQEK